jgi:hypothetical protein
LVIEGEKIVLDKEHRAESETTKEFLKATRHVIPAGAGIQKTWIPDQARNDNPPKIYIAMAYYTRR